MVKASLEVAGETRTRIPVPRVVPVAGVVEAVAGEETGRRE